MVKMIYLPNPDLQKFATEVTVTREIDHDHISVVVSDFRTFLQAMGFVEATISKYVPDLEPSFDSDEDYDSKQLELFEIS